MEEDMRICACKGVRTCKVCEPYKEPASVDSCSACTTQYLYCDGCKRAWRMSSEVGLKQAEVARLSNCADHGGDGLSFHGICVLEEFVSKAQEQVLCSVIDKKEWIDSQSGRRKQDFGPKVNFKKRKLKVEAFTGLPSYCRDIIERFSQCDKLDDFRPVEMCNLEYIPHRGSSITPHFDDFWLWGERLITLNLLSSTFLTFTPGCKILQELFAENLTESNDKGCVSLNCFRDENMSETDAVRPGDRARYNVTNGSRSNIGKIATSVQDGNRAAVHEKLEASCRCLQSAGMDAKCCENSCEVELECTCNGTTDTNVASNRCTQNRDNLEVAPSATNSTNAVCIGCTSGRRNIEVLVPMPRRSLLVVYGAARYEWMHSVKRGDISHRRLAMTFRELNREFLEGGDCEGIGKELLRRAELSMEP